MGRRWGAVLRVALGAAVVWAVYLLKGNLWFRLYPVAVCAAVLAAFSVSLFRTPLCEVFARRMGEELDAEGVRYCRRVTKAWVVFLACHTAVTVATVFLSREVWAFYNGFLAYVLLGGMFLGELVIRKRRKYAGRV
jgi:uncharacterized membrane protein